MESNTRGRSFGYYVSGHGWGHATRAAAMTAVLLEAGHKVCIVTNASEQPFSSVLPPTSSSSTTSTNQKKNRFATFRKANVDAGIVQPKAYDVDRQATFDCLKEFMAIRDERLREEIEWLKEEKVEVVLSDATFLGCAAAAGAGIPSILVTNFTFDSCYSYLSLSVPKGSVDEPAIPASLLQPYVDQTRKDYQQASLLLRFPGAIPMPSFDLDVPWPASTWIDGARSTFTPELEQLLSRPVESIPSGQSISNSKRSRKVVDVPLLTRLPSKDVYTSEFRTNLLNSLEIPISSHNDKILLVSFGAQSIPRPRSRPPSPISNGSGKVSEGYENVNGLLKSGRPAGLLPEGWIAVVCGLKGDRNEIKKDLPVNFYASDVDIYVPDITAISDVILGKLGYGTCSEALTTKTPFVYVPRPIFVEELGLKRMMKLRANPVELSRTDFEDGKWEYHILEAHKRAKVDKEEIKRTGFLDEKAGEAILKEIELFLKEEEESN